jgi:uncharacterized UBP type Zn finger protein
MADADADTESLPHYDVEVTPISSINYQLLKKATVDALNKFQTDCSANLPAEFTNYLDALMGEIDSTHKAHEMHVEKASSLSAKAEPSGNDTDGILKGKDGVRSSGERSLCNIGNMCYMNAAVQLMYSMTEFKTKNNNIPENPLIQYLTAMDSKEVDCASANKLATELYNFAQSKGFVKDRQIKQQEDPAELITSLFGSNTFNTESITFTQIDSVYTTTNTGLVESCNTNTNVRSHTQYASMPDNIKPNIIFIPNTSPQPLHVLPLPIPDVDTSFNKLELQKPSKCDSKSPPDFLNYNNCKPINITTISTQSVTIPGTNQQYFIVLLNRFDAANNKIKTRIDLTNASINLGTSTFTIKGCICHHGDKTSLGHYTYVEFKSGQPITVYDDTNMCLYNTYIESFKDRTVDVTGYVLLFEKEK